MARRSAKHVGSRIRHKLTVPLIAGIVLLLTVFSGLALAEGQGEVSSPTALPVGSTTQELAALTEDGKEVSAQPVTDPDAAEALPHTDLSRDEAEELLTSVFPSVLDEQAGVYADLEVDAFRSDYVAVVPPPDPGMAPGLISSLLPLRTEGENGAKEVVDLDLEHVGADLQPANPLVDLSIPANLNEGINLPEVGVGIGLDSAATRSASIVTDGAAFYPNVAEESDFSVVAIPTGVETLTQLRSAAAPTSQTYTLDLPQGAQLEETEDGGAIVRRNGNPLVVVRPPSALDADGDSVPVSLTVTGSTLSLNVSPAEDSAFPILVDPVFETYSWMNSNTNTGIYTDWREYTSNASRFKPSWIGVWSQTMHSGLSIKAEPGPVSPGESANWNYFVPRFFTDMADPAVKERPTSYIRNMTLSQLYFQIEEAAPVHAYPALIVGLWDENKGAYASAGTHYGTEGAYNGVSISLPNPGEYTDVKNGGLSLGTYDTTNYPRLAFAGNAWVEITDKDSPAFGEISSVPEWLSTNAGTPINYKVTDPGLGIHNLRLEYTRATGVTSSPVTGIGCTGNASNPCPRTVSKATKALPYYPDLMAQGENWVKVIAQDATSHFSEPALTRIKVDRESPEMRVGDTLTEQAKVGTNLPEYGLYVFAGDGDELSPAAVTPTGSAGTGSGQLERPQGVAVDDAGNRWLTDRVNGKVVEYDSEGKLVREINSKGSANGQINEPRGVAVAANGNIWVAEAGTNKRIQQFTPTGSYVSKITNAAFIEPWAVAIAPDGTLWITDQGSKKIYRYKQDGTLIWTLNPPWGSTNNWGIPYGVDVDEFGNAWVAMQETNKVFAITPEGNTLLTFGGTGTEAGKFTNPVDIAIAPSGNILVSDEGNSRIQEFRPGGGVRSSVRNGRICHQPAKRTQGHRHRPLERADDRRRGEQAHREMDSCRQAS